ncbi:37S ribosomal protein MRP17, mitochondrial AltName: Full=YmS16 [Cyberlindnera jadinii]|uniref:Small ribosomal subunit protein bS6m n=2 Tax=Cyberlindnera jadinii (strain ATCC 18201 / CBS 1600 / BCRC 20928 / JCM 3617 / NBRC 0987 / NRRL Y-1542) TaxID=983966 RepID=A0A0H5C7C2_CYBJN|nr:37S ribosomal protein MRP17, mitochondrial AltName: Full=YmS16 [Cyberlindnera jadinii]
MIKIKLQVISKSEITNLVYCIAIFAAFPATPYFLILGHRYSSVIELAYILFTMLYELIAIARVTNPSSAAVEAKEVASTIGRLIIQNRGVVRQIKSLGLQHLPKIMTKDQEHHFQGEKFLMLFDSSTSVQSEILRTLRADPRVIRSMILKVNDKKLATSSSYDRIRPRA